MSSRQDIHAPAVTGWVGWIAFAAVMMMLTGILNAISGLSAILADDVFVSGERGVLFLDVTSWGWVHLVLGAAVAGIGLALVNGAVWARVLGVGLVMLNTATQAVLLPAYPYWAMLTIGVNLLVLWAIVVHGHEARSL